MKLTVTGIHKNEWGFLITVDVSNVSKRPLFLPQSSSWPLFRQLPRIISLDVEQWSDAKTNLSPIGTKLLVVYPDARYYSLGPCRDAEGIGRWIRLDPGNTSPIRSRRSIHPRPKEILFAPCVSRISPTNCAGLCRAFRRRTSALAKPSSQKPISQSPNI
jgi:hypothetical protein